MRVAVAVLLGALAGCTAEPIPKAESRVHQVLRGQYESTVTAGGVRMTVEGNAWDGIPRALDAVVPVKVSIQNDSGRPLRVRFKDLQLSASEGEALAALPPVSIEQAMQAVGGSGEGAIDPDIDADRFFVVPKVSGLYAGLPTWKGRFDFDAGYYGGLYGDWPVRLPTLDMVRKAIPEGVIDRGGRVSGFLYFRNVPQGLDRVRLQVQLVDADTGAEFGAVDVPFIVKR